MSGKAGRSGRPPKTLEAKIADGSYCRERGVPMQLSMVPKGVPVKPAFQSADASQHWDENVPRLIDLGVATDADIDALRAMCEMWSLYRAAYELSEKDPTDSVSRLAVTAYYSRWLDMSGKFGMNPRGRSSLIVKKKSDQAGGIVGRQRA